MTMRMRLLWLAIGILAIGAVVSITALVMSRVTRSGTADNSKTAAEVDPWEQEHHAEIIQLKSEAEALAIAGRLSEAHEKYRQIMTLVGGRRLKDPLLFDVVEQAKTDQDRVYNILLKTMERDIAPVAPAPAPVVQGVAPAMPTTYPEQVERALGPRSAAAVAAPEGAATEPGPTTQATIASTARAAGPPSTPRKLPPTTQQLLDQQVGASIKASVDFLLSNFDKDELKAQPGDSTEAEQHGLNALCVYALLQAGQAIRDDRLSIRGPLMKSLIERMKKDPMSTDATTQAPVVYARSLRCAALAVYNRPEDFATLKSDVIWLGNVAMDGAYTYDDRFNRQTRFSAPIGMADEAATGTVLFHGKHNPDGSEAGAPTLPGTGMPGPLFPRSRTPYPPPPPPPPPRTTQPTAAERNPWDNSNSQYGLLGVWSGAECGVEVPTAYWRAVEKHWTTCQLADGRWGYKAQDLKGTYSMTCAGLASLFVTHDYLDAPTFAKTVGRDPYSPALIRGMAVLEHAENSVSVLDEPAVYVGYNVYGLERVALASGMKYFGKHDWYSELASRLIPLQWPNGAFGRVPDGFDAITDTAFTLLFLARGRHPVMMNKLRFEQHWSNRPRDLANLARFAGKQLERPLNWQVVNLNSEVDWPDWLDSPVLFIASHEPPVAFRPNEIDKLRGFVSAGGMIFTHADAGSKPFSDFVEAQLVRQLFPSYEMRDVPVDDVIYNANFKLKGQLPKLRGVYNGSRWLLIHSPTDLSLAWQTRNEKVDRRMFELGVNIFVYAAGLTDLRNRLDSSYVPPPSEPPSFTTKLARINYAGNWDPESYAWTRFARWFGWQTGQGLDVQVVPAAQIKSDVAPIAHLTGTAAYAPSDAEIAALRAYVADGGILLIDACGGSRRFITSLEADWLPKLLSGGQQLAPIKPDDRLLTGGVVGAEPVLRLALRPAIAGADSASDVKLQAVTIGKGRIIYCSGDLTSGLLGANTLGISGYTPPVALGIVKNAILLSESSPATP